MATKKAKAEKTAPGGIVLEQQPASNSGEQQQK
jgi:hypothetical protein